MRINIARVVGVVSVCIVLLGACKPTQKTPPQTESATFVSWKEFFKNPEVLEREMQLDESNASCLDGNSYKPRTTEKLHGACNYALRNKGPYSIELARFSKSGKPFNALVSFHPPIELEKLPTVLDISESWVDSARFIRESDDGSIIKVYRDAREPVAKKGALLAIVMNVSGGKVSKADLEFNPFDEEEDIARHRLDIGEPLLSADHITPIYFGPSRVGRGFRHDVTVRLTPTELTVNGKAVREGSGQTMLDAIEDAIGRHAKGPDRSGATPATIMLSPSHDAPWTSVQRAQKSISHRWSDDKVARVDLEIARAPSFDYAPSQWYAATLEIPRAEVGQIKHYKESGGEVVIYLEPDAVYIELSGELSATMFGAPSGEHFLRYDPKVCDQQERFDATVCLTPYIDAAETDLSILGQIGALQPTFETGASVTTSVDFEGHGEALRGYAPHRLGETIEHLVASIEKKHGKRPDRVAVRPHGMLSAQVVVSMLDVIQGNVEGMNVEGACDGVLEEKIKPLHWRRCEAPRFFSRVFFAVDG